jgi:hypothetical protein
MNSSSTIIIESKLSLEFAIEQFQYSLSNKLSFSMNSLQILLIKLSNLVKPKRKECILNSIENSMLRKNVFIHSRI